MFLIALAAISKDGVIGLNGKTPWHYPEDLKRFKAETTGQTVIMGRKTFDSIGKPLPNRKNIVLSHTRVFAAVDWVNSLGDLFTKLAYVKSERAYVIGGAEIYRQLLPFCHKLSLTHVPDDVQGDAFFPEYKDKFVKTSGSHGSSGLYYETLRRCG